MPQYLLQHRHDPTDCGAVFAAFKGHASPLRHQPTLSSCLTGAHEIWWTVEAQSPDAALRMLPFFVAARTDVVRVEHTNIP
jgi:hypothetical protein